MLQRVSKRREVSSVVAALEELAHRPDADRAPLDLPAGLEQTSFVVRKDAP